MPPLPIQRYDNASTLFRALAAPQRVAIVELLSIHGQLHVHQLVDALGTSQALTSQHLRVLRQARIVVRVQTGRETVYRLRDGAVGRMVAQAIEDGENQG